MIETKMLCVSGGRYFHKVSKKPLDLPLDPLSWLTGESSAVKFYLRSRDGKEVAAAGSLLAFDAPPQFEVGNESEATFYGGQAFFPSLSPKDSIWSAFPRRRFFLPEREVQREKNQSWGITHQINAPLTLRPFLPSPLDARLEQLADATNIPNREQWEKLIAHALDKIEKGSLQKVVMARRSSYRAQQDLDPFAILFEMRKHSGIAFAIQFEEGSTFIGITPERLYKRVGNELQTEAIAGTRAIGTDPKELLENPKEKQEFAFVQDSIRSSLGALCSEVAFNEVDILTTPNVIHLHSQCRATLLEGVGDGELLDALHPTGAMGGLPESSALEYLVLREPFERGWYASPLGYCSPNEAEFAVCIRSALVERKQMHLFAGAGIVSGSMPDHEWKELSHKVSIWNA